MKRLNNRIALVTGAGAEGGIGFAVARLFHEEGATVILADLDGEGAAASANKIGPRASGMAGDVRSHEGMQLVFDHIRQAHGRLDILVNNAGLTQPRRTVEISREDYDRIMDVNLRGTLIASQMAVPLMPAGSAIVCIASVASQRGGGLMGGPHYAASKAGVVGLTRAMARDLAADGIRVNAINPGVIVTDMTRDFYDDANTQRVLPGILLGRFGTPEDVAGASLFLASSEAAYITGTSLDVNGGMHMN